MARRTNINYDYNIERIETQFFIDREGVVHKYTGRKDVEIISIHYKIAEKLFPEISFPDSPDDHVMDLGWVMCGSSVYECSIIHKKPSTAQLDKLKELGLYKRFCFLYKNEYPNYDKYGALCDDSV